MIKRQLAGVQHRPPRPNAGTGSAVLCVTYDGVANRCQVHTNLMRATGLKATFE